MINPRTATILSGMKRLIMPYYPNPLRGPIKKPTAVFSNFHAGPIPHPQSNPPAVYSKSYAQPYAQNFEQKIDFWCKQGLKYQDAIWNNGISVVSPEILPHPTLEDSSGAEIKLTKPSSEEMVLKVNEIIQILQDSINSEIKLTKSLREAMALKESKIKQIPEDSDEAKISEAMALKESKIKQIPEDSDEAEIKSLRSLSEALASEEQSIKIKELLIESDKISKSVVKNLAPPPDIASKEPFSFFNPSSVIKPDSLAYAERFEKISADWQRIKIKRLGDAGRI